MSVVCFFINILLISASYGHGHLDCHGHECDTVNVAIANIGSAFDQHLCHAFRDVDCTQHVLDKDEQICASDGITYNNHCEYARARCVQILSNHGHHVLENPLSIVSHSACAVAATTSAPSWSTKTSSFNTSGVAATTTTAIQVKTTLPIVSTTSAPPLTTTVSTHSVLGSVFCQYKNSVNCSINLAVVCGSDGNFYPNKCELLKQQCDDSSLREVSDMNTCSVSP